MSFDRGSAGAGVDPSTGPPLAVPGSFFVAAAAGIAFAGLLLVVRGADCFAGSGTPASQALTHLLTLGFLGSTMLGALTQILPVVVGAPLPWPRAALGTLALLVPGVGLLVVGLLGLAPTAGLGGVLVAGGLLLFLSLASAGLRSSRLWTPTAVGVRLSLLGLLCLGALGSTFAAARGGHGGALLLLPGSYGDWRSAHAGLGLLVWIGGLLAAVSWQILPMFYVAPECPRWAQRAATVGIASSLLALPLCAALGWPMSAGWAPGLVAVWLIVPATGARALAQRRRKRTDWSVQAWYGSLGCGALAALLAVVPGGAVALAWVALWGWAGLAIHGMLSRIVPFLVWFHRMSPLVGAVAVPPMRRLLPPAAVKRSLLLHGASLLLGLTAIATGWDLLARLTGLLVLGVGLSLGRWVIQVLRTPAPAVPATAAPATAAPAP